jgi:large subunit ribosomal protein L24
MAVQKTESRHFSVKKGDKVVVISGKDKGKIGEVLHVDPKSLRVTVKGVNIITRHKKPTMMVYDPSAEKGVRIRHTVLENGQKVRVSAKTGENLDN